MNILMASITFFVGLILAALTSNLVHGAINNAPLPDIDLDEWWGPGNASYGQDTSIREFKIRFDDTMIKDLKYRLKNHRRFTQPLEGIGFQYGFNSDALNYWVKYLAEQYPFKQREEYINKYSQYTTDIQGLTIHFMRVRSKNIKNKKLVPLLILHGWPGSVLEFYEAIPHLLSMGEAKGLAFDIIAPSLPGFCFSEINPSVERCNNRVRVNPVVERGLAALSDYIVDSAQQLGGAVRPGLSSLKSAVILRNLMHRVGHKEYYVQGGDWGSSVGTSISTFFPNEVKGFHSNFPFIGSMETLALFLVGSLNPDAVIKPEVKSRVYPITTTIANLLDGTGYFHIQATRPDTVGFGLSDSPAGLFAYMTDKISNLLRADFLKRPDGGLKELLTPESLIDNFMMYWIPNSMTTAMRMYSEFFNKKYLSSNVEAIPSPVPAWVSQAPDEVLYIPTSIVKKKFPNLLHENLPSVGGHFYAWERPKDYAVDVIRALVAFRKWHESNSNVCNASKF